MRKSRRTFRIIIGPNKVDFIDIDGLDCEKAPLIEQAHFYGPRSFEEAMDYIYGKHYRGPKKDG